MSPPQIPIDNDELLAECDVQTFRASGKGGQNVNRRETAVRLRHRPTGTEVVCQRERHQYRNKQIALVLLRGKLERLNRKRKPRIATVMPHRIRERILAGKKRRAMKKKLRRTPDHDD